MTSSQFRSKQIRNLISLYFFELIRNKGLDTSEVISSFEKQMEIENSDLSKILGEKYKILLSEFSKNSKIFLSYFSDLAEIVSGLIISSRVHYQLKAILFIRPIVVSFKKKGINLSRSFKSFYRTVREIYDFLKQNYRDFFPIRYKSQKSLPHKEMMIRQYNYRRIVGSRIKLYLIKHIYSGYYSQDGKEGKCPKCLEENFMINSDISRLKALQFHHTSNIKEKGYSANNLLRYFSEDKNKILFLKKLIESAEHEKIDLLCGGHHITHHDDYFNQFKDLISWKDIFSLSADEINMLLITAIENFRKTKNLSVEQKLKLRENILNKLKKRYIIELFYGDKCHTCGEFNTRDHLPSFEFNHTGKSNKTQNIADAFHLHSCSEIVQIIENEGGGGYICSNCHSVLHFAKYIPLLDKIFDDVNIINRIRNDFKLISERFKSINKDGMIINDPLKKVFYGSSIRKALKILVGIKKLTDLNIKVTHLELESVTRINRANIFKFFRDNDLIKNYINIEKSIGGKGSGKGTPTIYSLNNRGAEFIEIIEKFKNLYKIQ